MRGPLGRSERFPEDWPVAVDSPRAVRYNFLRRMVLLYGQHAGVPTRCFGETVCFAKSVEATG
ncbi:MAG: hypothetical protein NCA08_07200 [Deltaproteobacteria bacterium]|nr:hypothetical protein [Candidatus Deferrimicrobium borealis]